MIDDGDWDQHVSNGDGDKSSKCVCVRARFLKEIQ